MIDFRPATNPEVVKSIRMHPELVGRFPDNGKEFSIIPGCIYYYILHNGEICGIVKYAGSGLTAIEFHLYTLPHVWKGFLGFKILKEALEYLSLINPKAQTIFTFCTLESRMWILLYRLKFKLTGRIPKAINGSDALILSYEVSQ